MGVLRLAFGGGRLRWLFCGGRFAMCLWRLAFFSCSFGDWNFAFLSTPNNLHSPLPNYELRKTVTLVLLIIESLSRFFWVPSVCHTPFGILRGDQNGCKREIWHAASLDNTNKRIKISSQCGGGCGRERVRRKSCLVEKRCFFNGPRQMSITHARCSFSSLPKLRLSNSTLEKEISRRLRACCSYWRSSKIKFSSK